MRPKLTDVDTGAGQSRISHATAEFALVAAMLVTSASFVAMSLGDPELMAFVALAGLAVLAVGLLALSANRPRLSRLSPRAA
jgi:predicted neutral ceramidase superfamily lipid hydrolase